MLRSISISEALAQEVTTGGIDVQQNRISVRTSHPVPSATKLEMTLSDIGGWKVVATHPWGHAFTGYFRTDAEVHQHISAWLAELRVEVALGRHETMEEALARMAGAAAAGEGA